MFTANFFNRDVSAVSLPGLVESKRRAAEGKVNFLIYDLRFAIDVVATGGIEDVLLVLV